MATSQPVTEYTPEQLQNLLIAAGRIDGRPTVQAAMHLLTFTELPHRRRFPELLDIQDVNGLDGPVTAAFVRDWTALPSSPAADRIGGGDQRLLALAVALVTGEPVDLVANVTAGGFAHARRVIEATAIATGYGEMYAITPTSQLDEMLAARDALFR